MNYWDGAPIRVGHRVIYNNQVGTVVVAIDDNEGSQGFPIEEWSTQGTGILIRFDNEALLLLNDSDEHLFRVKNDTA